MKSIETKKVRTINNKTLIVTVDISKRTNVGYCRCPDGTDIKPFKFDNNGQGFNYFWGRYRSHTGGLVNLLHYGDAISMSKSLESRNPFVDVNLVEFSFKLPFYYKMHNGLGKYIHRISMNNIVPKFILENPIKFGFNTPLSQHFDSFKKIANDILLSSKCLDRSIYDYNGLTNMIEDHIHKKRNNSTILFRLLSVVFWFRQFIDN